MDALGRMGLCLSFSNAIRSSSLRIMQPFDRKRTGELCLVPKEPSIIGINREGRYKTTFALILKEFSIVRIGKKIRKVFREIILVILRKDSERTISRLRRIEEKKARKRKARLEIATLWLENRYSLLHCRATPLLVPPIAVNFDLMMVKAPNATYS